MATERSIDALTPADQQILERHGIAVDEVERQRRLLTGPPRTVRLVRPCTPRDGIGRLIAKDHPTLLASHRELVATGTVARFVPAAGARESFFAPLLRFRASRGRRLSDLAVAFREGDADAEGVLRFLHGLERFPFYARLEPLLGASAAELLGAGNLDPLVDVVLGEGGLGFGECPTGLIPFHHDLDAPRSAFDEHVFEAAQLLRDDAGTARVHFSVSPADMQQYLAAVPETKRRFEERLNVKLNVTLSRQEARTDSIAVDHSGAVQRQADGALLLRPGGHGALLSHLEGQGGDVVLIRNLDNVAPDPRKLPTYLWSRLLLGHLHQARQQVFGLLRRIDEAPDDRAALADAQELAYHWFGHAPSTLADDLDCTRESVRRALDRPLRVCGMVEAAGEQGGAPLWVEAPDGSVSLQIVEPEEVDRGDGEQHERWLAASYFNPVFIAASLVDHHGKRFELEHFADWGRDLVRSETIAGRSLNVLHRPGLWNGGMARWNTLFVEVPSATYTPAKSLNDLLRACHRPG